MTEQEYIDATNLAKIRTAKVILHDCLAMNDKEAGWQREAMYALTKWEAHLDSIVVIDPEASDQPSGSNE